MTGEDSTIYHFDIQKGKFDEALDIFASFFHSPLFCEAALDREINIVDTEFKKNLSNQDKRIYQLVKSAIVNPGCKLSRFGTGNLESLKVDKIRKIVMQFYKEKYSANLMNVALVGDHSLNDLESIARKHFSSIENKNIKLSIYPVYSVENPHFSTDIDRKCGLGHLYKVVSEKELHKLIIVWPTLIPFD